MSKTTKSPLIYIASPYTSPDLGVREGRARKVARFAGKLIARGKNVFCPIAHSHFIASYSELQSCSTANENYHETDVHKMWMKQDLRILAECTAMVVYMLPGWKSSKGVQEEIDFCKKHNIPVTYATEYGETISNFDEEQV